MRLRTEIWISALIRRAESAGALVTVVKKGAIEAGTVFLIVDGGEGASDLYGPAPQSVFDTDKRAGLWMGGPPRGSTAATPRCQRTPDPNKRRPSLGIKTCVTCHQRLRNMAKSKLDF